MKVTHALSVRAPFAAQIVSGEKTVEYRTWSLPAKYLNVPIALHESGGSILAIVTFDAQAAGAWHVGSVVPLRPVAAPGAFLRFWKMRPATVRAIARQLAPPERWSDTANDCRCAICTVRR